MEENKHIRDIPAVVVAVIFGGVAGFGGGYLASQAADRKADNNLSSIQQGADGEAGLITKIAEEVGQSVVSVNVVSDTTRQTFFGPQDITQRSAGTGFIISSEGVVITNRHVVPKGVSKLSVTLSDGTELTDVSVIGRTSANDTLDLAFLKINDKKGKELKAAKIGDSTKVQVGQAVVAIGNALGQFQNTVTSGIISGYGRDVTASDGAADGETLLNLFQTDASINEGNSGGPLVNLNGEVIGINTAVAGGAENIGFAIPISDAAGLIKSVLEEGKLLRPFLGIRYISLTDDVAYDLNLNTKRGAYITPVDEGSPIVKDSPADKAGLREKDIIVKVNDTNIDERNSLSSVLGRFKVGDKVKLTIVRGDETITVDATLSAAPTE